MSTYVYAVARGKGIAFPKISLEAILYLLPVSLMLGTNFPAFRVTERVIYLGTNEILIGILVIGILFRHLLGKAKLFFPKNIFIPVALFSLSLPLSFMVRMIVTQEGGFLTSYIETLRWFEYSSIFFIIGTLIKKEAQIKKMLVILFVCALVNVAVGLSQAATFNFWEQRIYGLFISAANRDNISVSNPNVIGAVFMGTSLFVTSFGLNKGINCRKCFLAMLIPSTVALLFSLSRSAYLGFVFGVIILMLLYRIRLKNVIIVAFLLILTCLFVLWFSDFARLRIENSFNIYGGSVAAESILSRFYTWQETIIQVPQHPLFGVGFGAYEKYFGYLTPDNYYIEILATTGIIGLLLLAWMLFQIFIKVSNWKLNRNTFLFAFKAAYISSFIGFLTANIFAGLFFNPRLLGIFWLLTGLIVQTKRLHGLSIRRGGLCGQ